VDVLEEPGSADLTANVDFAYLTESLMGTGMFVLFPLLLPPPFCGRGQAPILSLARVLSAKADSSITGTQSLGPIPQSQFLLSLGLQPRLEKLLSSASADRREDMRKGGLRLIDPLGMGKEYQVMGITSTPDTVEVYPFPVRDSTTETITDSPGQAGSDAKS
jgi:NADH dehydrogenase [ubiquinone] 1 alpha subcomplex assembly factor 7